MVYRRLPEINDYIYAFILAYKKYVHHKNRTDDAKDMLNFFVNLQYFRQRIVIPSLKKKYGSTPDVSPRLYPESS